ncbi:S41 family peptidase [candidate division KSB1 bacterium]|nr:S41 family peptidase [candidate division KSB1 bacterium]
MNFRRIILLSFVSVLTVSLIFFSFRVTDAFDTQAEIYQKTRIFTSILLKIIDEYVDEKDPDVLLDRAIAALMEDLDPHSNFVGPRAFENMSERIMGYQGIGIQFRMIENKITVMRVLRDGPSERAGLKMGDRIIKIEGENAIGMEQAEVPILLKGPTGTRVNVTLERPGIGEIDVSITRGQAFLESVKYYFMLDDVTGYIHLETFSRTSSSEMDRALRHLQGQGMERLVFDLRENTGGLLPQAIEVADKFLGGNKSIVKTKGRIPSSNGEFNSTDSPADIKVPMIVLVDEQSASASEIVSGALQDWDRALIVGKTTFGKGLVQSQTQFDDRSALLLTIGRWYTPLGRLIQKDYTNKSRQQYRQDAASESFNLENRQREDRPTFTTPMGRTVYGGGGVTPDIDLESNFVLSPAYYMLTPSVRALLQNNQSYEPYFQYGQDFAVKNADRWSSAREFVEDYALEGAEYDSFIQFLNDKNMNFDEQDFDDESKVILEWNVRNRIAEFLWGDEGKMISAAKDYEALMNALEYFPEAEKLSKN